MPYPDGCRFPDEPRELTAGEENDIAELTKVLQFAHALRDMLREWRPHTNEADNAHCQFDDWAGEIASMASSVIDDIRELPSTEDAFEREWDER